MSKRHYFCNVLVFYSGSRLACVCQHLCLQYFGSQYLSVAYRGLPKRSAVTPSLGV